MKHHGTEPISSSRKTKAQSQMKAKAVPSNKVHRSIVMKTVATSRKKNDQKTANIELASRDTIAETIAFVIKGQLTPIKLTPLSDITSTKTDLKRLQKARCCKTKAVQEPVKAATKSGKSLTKKKINFKPADKPVITKHLVQAKAESKTIANEDLDTSIKKIIRKYAKKLRIKRTKRKRTGKPTEESQSKTTGNDTTSRTLDSKTSRISKPSISLVAADDTLKPRKKYVKRKADNKDVSADVQEVGVAGNTEGHKCTEEILEVKIKEEKLDVEFPIPVKTEPGLDKDAAAKPREQNIVAEIKPEPAVVDVPQTDATPSQPSSPKTKKLGQKLKLLKKKVLISKEAQKHLDDKRRAKLLQFWNSPKRHREASLNALAKVHCLYENESKAAFDRMTESSIIKREPAVYTDRSKKLSNARRVSSDSSSESETDDEQPVKRILRDAPGLRAIGKHWDMHDSISSDNNSDMEIPRPPKKPKVKKEVAKKAAKPAKTEIKEQQKTKRKPKPEVFMDLKDMVVKKRMASLNASAILAASYSTDKKAKPSKATDSSSYDSDSSAEEYFAAIEQIDLTKDTKEDIKQEEEQNLIEVHTTPNKKVAVILNQDTDVTITGVYVNSTTRSTHHEGYCSIAGMQYRISATSHTQTAATTVAAETLLQSGSNSDNAQSDAQSTSSKSYTPLDALSNMQPPPGPGIHNPLVGHPGMPCQPIAQIGSPPRLQHPSGSAFTSPHHAPPGYPPGPQPSGESPVGYVHGYYQPAGPLISVSHPYGPTSAPQPPPPKSVPLSDASPTSINSSIYQPQAPPAPGSNNGDSSDNEVIITSVTSGVKEPPSVPTHQPTATYRYPQYSQYHAYACPPQYHYQTPPPPPTPPYPHHEICYPTAPPGYLRHAKYAPSPSAPYHRYPYYSGHGSELYPPSSAPPSQPSQQMVTAASISTNGSYPPNPNGPPPAIMESYPPPPAPPTLVDAYQPAPHYYQSAYSLPPTCYSHSPTRAIPYINATYQHCPCPLNTCPKNGHTGPLTGESKRSNISKDSKPLPPVALALPLEPVSATGPPSPARGSAGMPSGGMPPPPSPAGANYQPPPVPTPKEESRSPETPQCKVEKRKARVGKANVRNNMQSTMLLMCNPAQNYVKREIESPKDKELHRNEEGRAANVEGADAESLKVPEACLTTTTTTKTTNVKECLDLENDIEITSACAQSKTQCAPDVTLDKDASSEVDKSSEQQESPPAPPKEEPLPPCIATVAENVKVKNMKRKQSQSKEPVPEAVNPPPAKKNKISSYKDFIRKYTGCFKINNGKKNLVSKASRAQRPKIKIKSSTKKKINAAKEQTNNRRIRARKSAMQQASHNSKKSASKKKQRTAVKTAPKILDNLIAKNTIDRVIDAVITKSVRTNSDVQQPDTKKAGNKTFKQQVKVGGGVKGGTNRRKSTSKCKSETSGADSKVARRSSALPKWSNGWMWEGESYESKVFINSDQTTLVKCYPSMRHKEGDLIRPGDCVLLKAGPRKNDLPYVAKIASLWENAEDGEMMMSLLWYYRPEHTEQGRLPTDQPDEVFASRHKDSNSVACIEDKCYVLTFNEYCRYKKNIKRMEGGMEERPRYVPLPDPYPRIRKQPPSSNLSPDMVFFCRKVYDFRQKRIIKNPT